MGEGYYHLRNLSFVNIFHKFIDQEKLKGKIDMAIRGLHPSTKVHPELAINPAGSRSHQFFFRYQELMSFLVTVRSIRLLIRRSQNKITNVQ